ncbi:MAG: PKD domain-containing protein [Archangium sp.]
MRALQRWVGVGLLVSLSSFAATLDLTGATLSFTLSPGESGRVTGSGATITFTASSAITRTGGGTGFNAASSYGGNLAASGVTSIVVTGGTMFSISGIETPMPASLSVATPEVDLIDTLRTDGRDVTFSGSGQLYFGSNVSTARTYTIDTDAPGGSGAAGAIVISQAEADPGVGGNNATVILDASADGSGAPGDVRVMGRLGGSVNTASVTVKGKDVRLGAVYVFGRFDLLSRTVELTGPIQTVVPGGGAVLTLAAVDDGAELQLLGTGTSAWHLDAAEMSHLLSGPNPWFTTAFGRLPRGGNVRVEGDFISRGALYLSGALVSTTGGVITFSPQNRMVVQAANHVEVGSIIGATELVLFGDNPNELTTQTAPIVVRVLDVIGTSGAQLVDPGNDVDTLRVRITDGGSFMYAQVDGFSAPNAEISGGNLSLTSGGAITSTFVQGTAVDIDAAAFSFYFANATTLASFVVDEFTFAPQSPGGGVGGTAVTSIRPRTPGRPVTLGGPPTPNPAALSLSRLDLASFAPTLASLTIGGASVMSVEGDFTLFPPTTLTAGKLTLAHTIEARRSLDLKGTTTLAADASVSTSTLTIGGALELGTNGLALDGGLAFAPSSTLRTTIERANEVGRVSVNGPVDLTNASLGATGAFDPPIGATVRILSNLGDGPIVGTFTGLPELAATTFNGTRVSYVDDGNDVSLIKVSSPTGIALTNSSVPEFKLNGFVVGTLSTVGSGVETRSYALVNGVGATDNGSFDVFDDQLITAAQLFFADGAQRSIRVSSSDAFGNTVEQVLIVDVVDNLPPEFVAMPAITATPAMPLLGTQIEFSAPVRDPEQDATTLVWDYGDGTIDSTGRHSYATAGTFTVKATASDSHASTTAELTLAVTAPEPDDITLDALSDEHPLAKLPGCGCSSTEAFSVLSLGLLALLRRRSRA